MSSGADEASKNRKRAKYPDIVSPQSFVVADPGEPPRPITATEILGRQKEAAAVMKAGFDTAGAELRESLAPILDRMHEEFTAKGGTKHDSGKPQLSLVSKLLIEELARVREFGAKKYAKNNWRKGFKYSRSIDACLRHVLAFKEGEDLDSESGLSHIVHAIACLEHLLHDYTSRKENDDRQ